MSLNKSPKKTSRAKKIAVIMAASLVGISVASIVSTICVYDSFFERYERPDYELYPGLYCYDRIKDELPRQELTIPSEDIALSAYYYEADNSRGLAVLSHGFHAGADDYLPLIEAIVKRGYSVLTYDVTGVYSTGGEDSVGMCRSLVDLDNVLNFAKEDARLSSMPKLVIGHSWGGYAAASVLALHSEIRAAVLIAPMNNGATVMLEKGEQYAGKAALLAKPVFEVYQRYLFGDYVKYNGTMGINSTTAPVLIAQGVLDTVITPDGQSITAHLDEITNPNVSIYYGEGSQGSHTGIWHSVESEEYQRTVTSRLKKLELEKGRALTDGELREFYSAIDHRLFSEVNTELIDMIIRTFDKGLEL
jgi:hypothetical protein